jgi:TonB family protein
VTRSTAIAAAVTASVGLHLLLVMVVPGLRLRVPIGANPLVEVELHRDAEAPQPEALTPPAAAPTPPLAPGAGEELGRALAEVVPPGTTLPPPPPPVRLPERAATLPEPDTLAWSPSPTWETEALPEIPAVPARARANPDVATATALAESLLRDAASQAATGPEPAQATMRRLEIEGPVGAERRVLQEPPPPTVPIRNPASVAIKFFVSPRGEVIRAFPTQRGDPELDRAALTYIKSFRFNPLPPGEEQEQWGTIRVRFRLE